MALNLASCLSHIKFFARNLFAKIYSSFYHNNGETIPFSFVESNFAVFNFYEETVSRKFTS